MNGVLRHTFVLLIIMLTSCSYTSSFVANRDKEYLTAKSVPPVKIPPGIAGSAFQGTYPVSYRLYGEAEKNVSVAPPGL